MFCREKSKEVQAAEILSKAIDEVSKMGVPYFIISTIPEGQGAHAFVSGSGEKDAIRRGMGCAFSDVFKGVCGMTIKMAIVDAIEANAQKVSVFNLNSILEQFQKKQKTSCDDPSCKIHGNSKNG